MKAIMLMYDSLNKDLLEPYGCDWTKTPNFTRLAQESVRFTKNYAGSLPCMPARRELHTGRHNFFHRSWGPIEPYDDSVFELLKNNGVYTHLISDHYHYWEDGGATYHTRYSSWEFERGQEGDRWKGQLEEPYIPEDAIKRPTHRWRQDWVNRGYMDREEKMPLARSVNLAKDFIDKNHDQDHWLLQLECFDPHEPFFTQEKHKDLYPHEYDGPHFDWPPYRQIDEHDPPQAKEHIRNQYAALLTMCDDYLGQVLDMMDKYNMWEDTMLIVNTDHGYMLGEHEWWGKNVGPTYDQIANTPLFIWDPRSKVKNEERSALVQTIDLAPTLYHYFNLDMPKTVLGKDLMQTIIDDTKVRDAAVYGSHGGTINCTDGDYVYMRAPEPGNDESYNYTLMCVHMMQHFSKEEMETARLVGPLPFTNGYPVLKVKKIKPKTQSGQMNLGDFLFDVKNQPEMNNTIQDQAIEEMMKKHIRRIMRENDVPEEVYVRYNL